MSNIRYCIKCAQIKCLCKLGIPIADSVLTLITTMLEGVHNVIINATETTELYINWNPRISFTGEAVCATVFVNFYNSLGLNFHQVRKQVSLSELEGVCNQIGETDPCIIFNPKSPEKYIIKSRFDF